MRSEIKLYHFSSKIVCLVNYCNLTLEILKYTKKSGSGLGPLDHGGPWHLSSLVQWVLCIWLTKRCYISSLRTSFFTITKLEFYDYYRCVLTRLFTGDSDLVENFDEEACREASQWRHQSEDHPPSVCLSCLLCVCLPVCLSCSLSVCLGVCVFVLIRVVSLTFNVTCDV